MSKKENVFFVLKMVLYFLGSLGIILTILPLLQFDVWWIRVWDFPRVQILVVCIFVIILSLISLRPIKSKISVFLITLFLCTLYQIYCIIPYTPVYPIQVEKTLQSNSKNNIKILTANVLMDNRDVSPLLKLIAEIDPDVILLAEPNERWIEKIKSLENKYPHTISKPLENKYGIAMYSRLELIDPQIKFLVESDIPSIHTDIKLKSGKIIKFYGVHPRPPGPTEAEETTERDAELIIVGKEVKKLNRPTIVAGDLNDVAWSRTTSLFQKISQMLDPRIGRGFYNSFHADYFFMRFPLDHVFHTTDFRLVEMKRLRYIKSDHFPIYINLSLEETAEKTQEEPKADADEKDDAEEMVEEAEEMKNKLEVDEY